MESTPRKASDVLLDLEKKLDIALSIIRSQDLNIKILSNKLNSVMESMEKQSKIPQKITVEAVNTTKLPTVQSPQFSEFNQEKQIPISSEDILPLDMEPKGFRRTSRPESYAGDDAYLSPAPSKNQVQPKFPAQAPKAPPGRSQVEPPPGRGNDAVVPPAAVKQKAVPPTVKQQQQQPRSVVQNAIPVMQRVVDGSGKSLFLADVEVIDLSSMQAVVRTRTNGTGKWMASLGVGTYRVVIRKIEKLSGEKKETLQEIMVDGSQSPFELQTIIIK